MSSWGAVHCTYFLSETCLSVAEALLPYWINKSLTLSLFNRVDSIELTHESIHHPFTSPSYTFILSSTASYLFTHSSFYPFLLSLSNISLSPHRDFYARKANAWITYDPTPAYLIKTEKAIEDEKQRISSYLNSETEAKVLRVLEEEVLEKRESALLEKEVCMPCHAMT